VNECIFDLEMGEETKTKLSRSVECYVASKVGVVPSALGICM
jgi:hypothetical protein